jgi:hypothetical protein
LENIVLEELNINVSFNMLKLVEIDSSDEESNEIPTANEKSNETPAADGGLYETSTADGAVNETYGVDQGEGADTEKAAEGDKGDGLLSGLMDQAKYISQSLDDTLTTLMKLKVDNAHLEKLTLGLV